MSAMSITDVNHTSWAVAVYMLHNCHFGVIELKKDYRYCFIPFILFAWFSLDFSFPLFLIEPHQSQAATISLLPKSLGEGSGEFNENTNVSEE